jgi:hypothetical protein
MQSLTENYLGKIAGCNRALTLLGVARPALLAKYAGACFRDSPLAKREVFWRLLDGSLDDTTRDYLDAKCAPLRHFRDGRKPHEYAVDLMLGWLIEDAVLAVLKVRGLDAELDGKDRERDFLSASEVSTRPDITVKTRFGKRAVEIYADWKETWRKYDRIDLRDKKFERLRAKRVVLFGVAPLTAEGFVLDFGDGAQGFQKNFIRAYDKDGHTKNGIREKLLPLDGALASLAELLNREPPPWPRRLLLLLKRLVVANH